MWICLSCSFKGVELNFPSSQKKILAVKKIVQHFRLYHNPIKLIIWIDLKIIPRILKNETSLQENSSHILKWFGWLQNFDFEIEYKLGYLNSLVDMLSREQ